MGWEVISVQWIATRLRNRRARKVKDAYPKVLFSLVRYGFQSEPIAM